MAILMYCVTSKALGPHIPEVSRRRQTPAGLTMNSWGINRVQPIRRATEIRAVDPPGLGELLGGGDLPFPNLFSNIPSWVTFVVGVSFAAVTFYRQMRAMQDKVEQTAETAIEVVDKVAEAAEKIAEDVAEAFPENQTLKKAASKIKAVADEIEEDADKAQSLLHKIDQIEEEMDELVDSFIKEKKNP